MNYEKNKLIYAYGTYNLVYFIFYIKYFIILLFYFKLLFVCLQIEVFNWHKSICLFFVTPETINTRPSILGDLKKSEYIKYYLIY